ncbi:MAG: PQQ-dependent sugar dehydrogenase [Candidatus Heimdallarchaeota archaeon]
MAHSKGNLQLTSVIAIVLIGFASFAMIRFSMSSDNDNDAFLVKAFPNLSFERPVDFQHANDSTNRVFVVEQAGRIHVFNNSATASSTQVFLDITDRVSRTGNEEGLLGLVFHPEYLINGQLYVYYSAANPRRSVVAQYQVSSEDSNSADSTNETTLLEIPQPFGNHNGGQIVFGPDGYLYIGLGDGGSGGDPLGHSQNRSTLLGSIIRIDVDNPANGKKYGIPADNPFVGNQEGFREEIWAYGLRNPWRFSFDPVTGWLWAADVGQNRIEEIDIIEGGKNYGWNIKEGTSCYNPSSGCDSTGLVDPIWEYSHSVGSSITGGFVYRGTRAVDFQGVYIFGDFISGRIWALSYNGSNFPEVIELQDTGFAIASFGTDQANELHILAFDGHIYQFKADEVQEDILSSTTSSSELATLINSSETTDSKPIVGLTFFFGSLLSLIVITMLRNTKAA